MPCAGHFRKIEREDPARDRKKQMRKNETGKSTKFKVTPPYPRINIM
jgi:hypothetical protein